MTALPDFTCKACGKRWLARSVNGNLEWSAVDVTTGACETCRAAPPPTRSAKRTGLRPVASMRARENAARAKRGEPPMVDVPFVEGARRVGAFVGRLLGREPAPTTPKEPDAIEASAETVEDDESPLRRMTSG